MKTQLLSIAVCAAALALGAQAQTSSGSAGGSSTDPSSSSSSTTTSPSQIQTPGSSSYGGASSSRSDWSSQHLSATGRMGHQAVRASQLTGALVSNSSGSEIGTISDTIINPSSGRLEFAILSLSGNAGAGATSATGTTSSTAAVGGKQVAVPWMLLRSSSSGMASSTTPSSTTSTITTGQTPSFVFAGDTSKLDSAPSFDANTDLNQPSWRQSVFSYFGLSGISRAAGGAETPGSSSSGTGTSGSTTPQSPSGNP